MMKKIIILFSVFYSILAFSCTDLSGNYISEEGERFQIVQEKCDKVSWVEPGSVKTIIVDGVERLLQEEEGIKVFGAAKFSLTHLVLNTRIDWGGKPGTEDLPTEFIMSYSVDRRGNLVEKQESSQGVMYTTYLKQ